MWYFPTKAALPLNTHSKYFLMDDAYERAATIGFRCAYEPAGEDAEAAGEGDAVGGERGDSVGLALLLIASILAAAAAFFLSVRRRYLLYTASAAAALDSAFDAAVTPDSGSPRDGSPSPWSLNDAAAEAVQRMNEAVSLDHAGAREAGEMEPPAIGCEEARGIAPAAVRARVL